MILYFFVFFEFFNEFGISFFYLYYDEIKKKGIVIFYCILKKCVRWYF